VLIYAYLLANISDAEQSLLFDDNHILRLTLMRLNN
jgi:hypothetical protein